MPRKQSFIPALRFHALTEFYDAVLSLTMRDETFKGRLIGDATIRERHRVLDLGCGTATLTLMIKAYSPNAFVVGLDPDRTILATAKAKSEIAGIGIEVLEGMAHELPLRNESFDWIFTSLVLHHLTTDNKRQALSQCYRVLKPGGKLRIADFGKPHTSLMTAVSWIVRFLEEAGDNIKGLIPVFCREAGFHDVHEIAHYSTLFGTVRLLQGSKPLTERKESH